MWNVTFVVIFRIVNKKAIHFSRGKGFIFMFRDIRSTLSG